MSKEGWYLLEGETVYVQHIASSVWHYESPSKGWQILKPEEETKLVKVNDK
jgi:hypothetical protein